MKAAEGSVSIPDFSAHLQIAHEVQDSVAMAQLAERQKAAAHGVRHLLERRRQREQAKVYEAAQDFAELSTAEQSRAVERTLQLAFARRPHSERVLRRSALKEASAEHQVVASPSMRLSLPSFGDEEPATYHFEQRLAPIQDQDAYAHAARGKRPEEPLPTAVQLPIVHLVREAADESTALLAPADTHEMHYNDLALLTPEERFELLRAAETVPAMMDAAADFRPPLASGGASGII